MPVLLLIEGLFLPGGVKDSFGSVMRDGIIMRCFDAIWIVSFEWLVITPMSFVAG